jgi:hypothetical protein
MANKNDTTDLENFFLTLTAIICTLAVFVFFCLALAAKLYGAPLVALKAQLSSYIQQQWQNNQ